jgi:hypothetical protein
VIVMSAFSSGLQELIAPRREGARYRRGFHDVLSTSTPNTSEQTKATRIAVASLPVKA